MKYTVYYFFAAAAILFASCSKEIQKNTAPDGVGGETITFSASIELGAATKASLDGLSVKWSDGDYIGVATNNNANIVAYPVTVDTEDATKCTITVRAVPGATAYYAVFRGSNGDIKAMDFSGITFNTENTTFSGFNVGYDQVSEGFFNSHLYKSNGFPLAMIGKASGTSLVMKPCLALVKVQIDKESVFADDAHTDDADKFIVDEEYTSEYNSTVHNHTYSAIRGFDFFQKGASTIYCSGDFTAGFDGDGNMVVAPAGNNSNKQYRRNSQDKVKLTPDSPMYMCVIPGGSVSSFEFSFYGFEYEGETLKNGWDYVYTMNLAKSGLTVNPGDFFDMGTLNPVGLKRTKDHAADEAADEAAASYSPAITVDGNMSDWSEITASYSNSGNVRIREWRFKSDSQKIYFYIAMRRNRAWDAVDQLYIGFNKDNDDTTGNSYGNVVGCEAYAMLKPFTNTPEGSIPVCVNGIDSRSEVWGSGVGYHNGTAVVYANDPGQDISSNESIIYYELSIPREYLNLPAAGNSIKVGCSYAFYTTATVSVTLE